MIRIYGIDFTSAPRRGKAITLAKAELNEKELMITDCEDLTSTTEFGEFLMTPGPWIAAIDFPFGQPRKLVLDYRWPCSWEGYVDYVSKIGKEAFEGCLRNYRDKTSGKRRLRRQTDVRAGSLSPMQLDFTPVGKMFFTGAPLLQRSPCTVIPFRICSSGAGIIVEGYPKLVAVKAIGRQGYKSDLPIPKNAHHRELRNSILKWIQSPAAQNVYGYRVGITESIVSDCLDDPKGDKLDALLCVMQAAWSLSKRRAKFGVPDDCDLLEGWIVDPALIITTMSGK
ncbi:hypothetical protein [Dehalococcoides mccartyi]|uniref:hypothetical protein n=1 Tax=Dehalococcoides mccartyi TaxID=61435 RepID=UPI0019FA5454|nr:hypothetical protein [Dehalococcoides mccartyi]MBF4481840.1 DUF429 domain-containing protein [Dehalococcoides mccartyi]MBJ7531423.1 hypothetical protein [Dehalococcoides mccartyi]